MDAIVAGFRALPSLEQNVVLQSRGAVKGASAAKALPWTASTIAERWLWEGSAGTLPRGLRRRHGPRQRQRASGAARRSSANGACGFACAAAYIRSEAAGLAPRRGHKTGLSGRQAHHWPVPHFFLMGSGTMTDNATLCQRHCCASPAFRLPVGSSSDRSECGPRRSNVTEADARLPPIRLRSQLPTLRTVPSFRVPA